jgi:integrase
VTSDSSSSSTYTPFLALPWWDRIGPFLTALVEDVSAELGVEPRSLYPSLTPFVLWCWQTKALDLDRQKMFRRSRIESFVINGMPGMSPGTKNTVRGKLLRVSEAVVTEVPTAALRGIGRSSPTPPYDAKQRAELYSWARTRGTATARRDASVLLALGFGAGLPTRELLAVRRQDVALDGSTVRVRDARRRTVPIVDDWQPVLRRAIETLDQDDWVFRASRHSAASGQVADFVRRTATDLDIRPARMRSTWLCGRLANNTPVDTLLLESGVQTYASLDRYRVFLPLH